MRGDGRIYRREGKNFLTIDYYGPRKDGRWGQIRESAGTLDRAKAEKVLERRRREAKNHRAGLGAFEGPETRKITVGELFDDLLAFYRTKGIKGLYDVELRLRRAGPSRDKKKVLPDSPLRAFFGGKRAAAVTTANVETYINNRRGAGRKNATINRETELLGRAFKLGWKRKPKKVVALLDMPEALPEKNVRQDFLEPDDFERVLPYLPQPLDDVARFAYKTGWRLGMMLSLTWEMVDRAGGEIRLPDSKNDEPVSVPLDEELTELIGRRWAARQFASSPGAGSYVFHRGGRPLFGRVCQKQWRRACRKAGLPDSAELHGFRRTAARNMVRAGVPETVAMKITGHKTRSMFDRYNITSGDDKLKALRAAREYATGRMAERLAERNVAAFKLPDALPDASTR